MPMPAIAAVLARLAPMIESVAASGGASAAAGTAGRTAAAGSAASAGEGLAGMVGRLFGGGGAQAFGSSQELGGAIQRLEDIASITASLRESSATAGHEQTKTAARFREDERFYMMGSNQDRDRLVELEQQRAANAQQTGAMRREAAALEARVRATTSPSERSAGLGSMLALGATAAPLISSFAGQSAASPGLAAQLTRSAGDIGTAPLGPLAGLVRNMPGPATAGNVAQGMLQPFTDLGVGREEGAVMGSGASFLSEGAKIGSNPLAMLRGEGFAHMARLPGLIRDWGDALVDSKRGLVQFNGTIAHAFAEAERRGIVRSMDSGERIGGATAGLSDALQDLYDEVQPIKDAVTVVLSRGIEGLVRGVEKGVELLKVIYEALKVVPIIGESIEAIEKQIAKAGQGDANIPLHDFIRDVKDRPITAFPRAPRPGKP